MAKSKLESRVIFDNFLNDDCYEEGARENLALNGIDNPTEEQVWDEISRMRETDWEDASYELRHFFDGGNWLAIGTVGRWNGIYDAGTQFQKWDWFIDKALRDCAYWRIEETPRGHFIVTGWHHDGKVRFEIKRLSEKGAAYLENYGDCAISHQTAWSNNFLTSLPHYCKKVWGVGA